MNKKKYLESEFNLCLSLDYSESPVNISQGEVDILLEGDTVLDIHKTKINNETTLLTTGQIDISSIMNRLKR